MIAPKLRAASTAFMPCPGVSEVVTRSPTSMGARSASTLQYAVPTRAMVAVRVTSRDAPRVIAGAQRPRTRHNADGALVVAAIARRERAGVADHHHRAGRARDGAFDLEPLGDVGVDELDVTRNLDIARNVDIACNVHSAIDFQIPLDLGLREPALSVDPDRAREIPGPPCALGNAPDADHGA